MPVTTVNSARVVLLDAHVHFHTCFDVGKFLNGAWDNFGRAAQAAGADGFCAYLLMTETAYAHWFDDLSRRASACAEVAPGWTASPSGHPAHVRLAGPKGAALNVISGYQIITTERLEVLALGCVERIPDGAPMRHTIDAARALGAIPVVPWGFGKWLGRRGEHVRSLLESPGTGELFFGDNSNRLSGLPEPPILRRAKAAGFHVLPGTDPLPFPREAGRVGALGFSLECEAATEDPDSWSVIREKIGYCEAVRPFGSLEGPWAFARNQIAMQLHKRSGALERAA